MNKVAKAIDGLHRYHYDETYRKLRISHDSWLIYLYIFKFQTITAQICNSINDKFIITIEN
jgi:hypothetical protein